MEKLSKIIPSDKGCYIVIFKLEDTKLLRVGSLGYSLFPKGIYAYVGSAKGPGGLKSRILRHLRKAKKIRWHIDYLTSLNICRICSIILLRKTDVEESFLVQILESLGGIHLIKKFGSFDDKKAYSHLLYFGEVEVYELTNLIIKKLKDILLNSEIISLTLS